MPTAAVTKKQVPTVSNRYTHGAALPSVRYPSIRDFPFTEAYREPNSKNGYFAALAATTAQISPNPAKAPARVD